MLCFNRLSLSKQCLASYFDTISAPYELIIVDNGSTDGTQDWLEGIRSDPRISRVIHREQNDGAAALNEALASCNGEFLHVMENDYVYLEGWDAYVLRCFDEIAELGQLCVCYGASSLMGEHRKNLVYVSNANVVSSSVFRRSIYFDLQIRWQNLHECPIPDDVAFSGAVKKAGFLVAWPDKIIAQAVGFSPDEIKRDPHYYLKSYRQKLHDLKAKTRLGE